MTLSLVECIANFSEARRPEVIEAISQSISSVPPVRLLDRHSDLDHNRTVITFIGPPEAVEEAAFRAIAKAAELIDLDQHTGEHPRIGATDVVPFVPIANLTMQDCVQLAKRLGARVGNQLRIPVYLYEEAATRPERQNLENIRRGQYEALKQEIATNPDREPDFGPARLGPAGATVIGARQPLIAYNVYLTSDDVSVAEKISKSIRYSSGGLRFVKALGMLVEGRAQISMNLTNYRKTPIPRVVEMIRREAGRYGVAIHHCELVGLIPQEALIDSAVWYLQLDQFESDQILENKLFTLQTEQIVESASASRLEFLDELAAGTPAPGGGSAAAYSGAAAAALVSMLARLTVGKKKYAAVEDQMQAILSQAESLRSALTHAIQEDAAAFEQVMAAFKLPKESPEQQQFRLQAIEKATLSAIAVPLDVARMSVDVLDLAASAISLGNVNTICDGGTGAALARAALTGAGLNVRTNVAALQDPSAAAGALDQLQALEARAAALEQNIAGTLQQRGGFFLA